MAQQTRLEKEAIELRHDLLTKNDYREGTGEEYSENHPDALSDGDVMGKGTGIAIGVAKRPGESGNKGIDYSTIDTFRGGGKIDIEMRNKFSVMNLYGEGHEYGRQSIDTTANEADGQLVVR